MSLQLLEILYNPTETKSLLKLYTQYQKFKPPNRPLSELSNELGDKEFCYAALSKVSRSFAVVIQKLPEPVKDAVCIFYLILRALDTIEDDTTIDTEKRKQLLLNFAMFLQDPSWHMKDVGDQEDYKVLLENFPKVIAIYNQLIPDHQMVISNVCKEMAAGMVIYLDKEVKTIEAFDDYCYYVAGVVGEGLTQLFVHSGLESKSLLENPGLSVGMGLFLQKTNIIRDILEDFQAKRTFWPKEIWGLYVSNLEDLFDSPKRLDCLNHMIIDALRHASESLKYLNLIKNPHVFQFCAIPQVMAMATLCELYNNSAVFKENVKIRKGLAAYLMFESKNNDGVQRIFKDSALRLFSDLSIHDPNAELQVRYLKHIINEVDGAGELFQIPVQDAVLNQELK